MAQPQIVLLTAAHGFRHACTIVLANIFFFFFKVHTYIRGQIIQTVKYADDLVLMAKEGTVLQGMIDKLIETGRYYGMEMNVEKTKVMRISR